MSDYLSNLIQLLNLRRQMNTDRVSSRREALGGLSQSAQHWGDIWAKRKEAEKERGFAAGESALDRKARLAEQTAADEAAIARTKETEAGATARNIFSEGAAGERQTASEAGATARSGAELSSREKIAQIPPWDALNMTPAEYRDFELRLAKAGKTELSTGDAKTVSDTFDILARSIAQMGRAKWMKVDPATGEESVAWDALFADPNARAQFEALAKDDENYEALMAVWDVRSGVKDIHPAAPGQEVLPPFSLEPLSMEPKKNLTPTELHAMSHNLQKYEMLNPPDPEIVNMLKDAAKAQRPPEEEAAPPVDPVETLRQRALSGVQTAPKTAASMTTPQWVKDLTDEEVLSRLETATGEEWGILAREKRNRGI